MLDRPDYLPVETVGDYEDEDYTDTTSEAFSENVEGVTAEATEAPAETETEINSVVEIISNSIDLATEGEAFSVDTSSMIIERLDTIIDYQNVINTGIWSLTAAVLFFMVVKILWTMFDKWFFGGI